MQVDIQKRINLAALLRQRWLSAIYTFGVWAHEQERNQITKNAPENLITFTPKRSSVFFC